MANFKMSLKEIMSSLTHSFVLLSLVGFPLDETQAWNSCPTEKLVVYRVVMRTFWSREDFPKHYPDWRPKAHFSRLVGRSHSESFKLFQLEDSASNGLRTFAETGDSSGLSALSQGDGGVLDEFNAPPVHKGVGQTEAEFFVDGNHSLISIVSRLVPSPDWFVGVDSLDLCNHGSWISSLTIPADPLDAGTDNGLTFTAPNWPSEPADVIRKLTTKYPNHPASSFFYTDREELPPIASFQFVKVKEYELSQVFDNPEENYMIATNEVLRPNMSPHALSLKSSINPSMNTNSVATISEYLARLEKKKVHKALGHQSPKKLRKPRGNKPCALCSKRRHHKSLFNW